MSYTEKWKVLRCQEMSIDENVKTNQKHLCVRVCVRAHKCVWFTNQQLFIEHW